MEQRIPIANLLCEQMREEVGTPQSLSEMEQTIREVLLWLGRMVLQLWLMGLEQSKPARKIGCPCGGEASYWGRRKGTLHTMFGGVKYRRGQGFREGAGTGPVAGGG